MSCVGCWTRPLFWNLNDCIYSLNECVFAQRYFISMHYISLQAPRRERRQYNKGLTRGVCSCSPVSLAAPHTEKQASVEFSRVCVCVCIGVCTWCVCVCAYWRCCAKAHRKLFFDSRFSQFRQNENDFHTQLFSYKTKQFILLFKCRKQF